MTQARRSGSQRLGLWLAQGLLRPLRRRHRRLEALLLDRLDQVLAPIVTEPEAGLAVLEGPLALAEADGEIRPEEWILFERGMARLELSDGQRQRLSLHGSLDLRGVCAVLTAIDDPALGRAIAQFYGLLVAADGQGGASELAVLRPLLRALNAVAIEAEIPRLAARYRLDPGWLEQCCSPLGQALIRWCDARRSHRSAPRR